jgi:hypothetical protein
MSFYRRLPGRAAALALLSWLFVALVLHLRAEREGSIQFSTLNRISSAVTNPPRGAAVAGPKTSSAGRASTDDTGDRTRRTAVVVATTASENASWLDDYFPQWEKNIYTVGDRKAKLKIPKNKGRESMVYLRCVVVSCLCD